jgi:septal ring factor EnvC (AmiA/AmiB activator)
MLEQEKTERQGLALNFQERMKEVTQELERQKEKRGEELKENSEIKHKIQNAINEYKKKEEAYRSTMDGHSKQFQEIEKKLKTAIDGSITKTIKEAETEKAKFLKSCGNVQELSEKINGFM